MNSRILVDTEGTRGSIRLTDRLFATDDAGRPSPDVREARDAVRVRLSVSTKLADKNHNTIGRLNAVVELSGRTLTRTVRSYCRSGILMFVASISSGVDMLDAGGTQQDVLLSFGKDGALVAKLGYCAAALFLSCHTDGNAQPGHALTAIELQR